MNLIQEAKHALKLRIDFTLATPLLLRSGNTGDVTDSTIERAPAKDDGTEQLFINGYVWVGLLRRSLGRLPQGKALAKAIGKDQGESGVSPLWCDSTVAELHGTSVNPGIAIDRKWGAAKSGALFNDELAIAGLGMTMYCTLFAADRESANKWLKTILDALRLIDNGIENIGGGWTYGYGRLSVEKVSHCLLDLRKKDDRTLLWKQEGVQWKDSTLPAEAEGSATIITVKAKVADGQLMAVKSGVFPMDAEQFGKLPDSFVFRRNIRKREKTEQVPVIPGKAIRQALLSVPLERKWRSAGKTACEPSEKKGCGCLRCQWFGSTGSAGLIAVTDALLENPLYQVISRIQLCEHSMQNMNLFSGEYLTGGEFSFRVIIDQSRGKEAGQLVSEITGLLDEMKGESAPSGWYRIGGTATCTGQVEVLEYTIAGGGES